MSLASGLRKLSARPPVERRLLLEAAIRLAWAWAMIRLLSFRRIAALLRFAPGEEDTALPSAQVEAAAKVGQAIRSAARRTPWQSACLGQALAAAVMLRRRGIPGTLYLGVARDGTQRDRVAAHAWLRCGDVVITGADGYLRFAVVGRYRWK
jgi:hypothetical protein